MKNNYMDYLNDLFCGLLKIHISYFFLEILLSFVFKEGLCSLEKKNYSDTC